MVGSYSPIRRLPRTGTETLGFFVHDAGICESTTIGDGTRIWAFAHVLPGARIGRDCNVCDHVFIENDVVIGDRVTIKCGVQVWDGVPLSDDVFVGPNVTFTNDLFPRSKVYPEAFTQTMVGAGASLGANATILPGVNIGRNAMIGAGAVVTNDIPPNAIVVGNPARIVGYVDATAESGAPAGSLRADDLTDSRVPGATLVRLTRADDLRGSLVAANFDDDLPFVPRRFFTVFGVPSTDVRGAHAHRRCQQLLVCVQGSVTAVVDNGEVRQEFLLDRPDVGLHMEPMIWGTQYRYSADAVLLVLASHAYDAADYIRDHETFLRLQREAQGSVKRAVVCSARGVPAERWTRPTRQIGGDLPNPRENGLDVGVATRSSSHCRGAGCLLGYQRRRVVRRALEIDDRTPALGAAHRSCRARRRHVGAVRNHARRVRLPARVGRHWDVGAG